MFKPVAAWLLLIGLTAPSVCLAVKVQIPITLEHQFIESLLREQVFTGAGGSLRLNDDGSGCQFLELTNPRVSASGGQVQLRTAAVARAGHTLAGRCMLLLNWSGDLEFTQQPVIGADGRSILLRTSSWRALRADGQPDPVISTIGSWLEQFLPTDLRATPISLIEPLNQLKEFLALVVITDDADRAGALLDSISIDQVQATNNAATVTLGIEVPPVSLPPLNPEPILSAAEISRLSEQLDSVDAFVSYTIKSMTLGVDTPEAAALLDVLLNLRLELIEILSQPQRRSEDPARALFVTAWDGLSPVLQLLAAQRPDQQSGLRFLSFIAAGDALRALDDLGPAAGVDISSNGLRRMARILLPEDPADPQGPQDPLQRSDGVDAELRRSLGFGDPIPPPAFYNESSWIDWLIPKAYAAGPLDSAAVKKLNNWAPKPADMDAYLPMVGQVLDMSCRSSFAAGARPQYHGQFRLLVLATAWQESCWRQFVARKDKRVPLESRSGDLGMMQINPRVWRGFYDLHGLKWDLVYNARAGADILEHFLVRYSLRHREHEKTGRLESLARSAYAAYNGGPREYDRYRRTSASARRQEGRWTLLREVPGAQTGPRTGRRCLLWRLSDCLRLAARYHSRSFVPASGVCRGF